MIFLTFYITSFLKISRKRSSEMEIDYRRTGESVSLHSKIFFSCIYTARKKRLRRMSRPRRRKGFCGSCEARCTPISDHGRGDDSSRVFIDLERLRLNLIRRIWGEIEERGMDRGAFHASRGYTAASFSVRSSTLGTEGIEGEYTRAAERKRAERRVGNRWMSARVSSAVPSILRRTRETGRNSPQMRLFFLSLRFFYLDPSSFRDSSW